MISKLTLIRGKAPIGAAIHWQEALLTLAYSATTGMSEYYAY